MSHPVRWCSTRVEWQSTGGSGTSTTTRRTRTPRACLPPSPRTRAEPGSRRSPGRRPTRWPSRRAAASPRGVPTPRSVAETRCPSCATPPGGHRTRPRPATSPRRCSAMADPLLRVRDLVTTYPIRSALLRRKIGEVRAVDGVSFDIARGQTVGLVGESGSGKSTLARTVIGLEHAEAGSIEYQGTELVGLSAREMRPVRRDIQMVFQDPYTALNPRLTVRQILSEAWRIHPDLLPTQDWDEEIRRLLEIVGLDPQYADRYPHQFSGGQRQRVGIARALAVRPKLIVCDEAVSALDVSVQAQVLNLLDDLQAELGLTYLLIAHDLSVVRHISDEVIVMNRGQVRSEERRVGKEWWGQTGRQMVGDATIVAIRMLLCEHR